METTRTRSAGAGCGVSTFDQARTIGIDDVFCMRASRERPGGEVGKAPPQGSTFFYLGKNVEEFVRSFSPFGVIVVAVADAAGSA